MKAFIVLCLFAFSSCGMDEQNLPESEQKSQDLKAMRIHNQTSAEIVAVYNFKELPECTEENLGMNAFVANDRQVYFCHKVWNVLKPKVKLESCQEAATDA